MSPQSRITPIAVVLAGLVGIGYGAYRLDEVMFAYCCCVVVFGSFELRQTVLFNRDVRRVNRSAAQQCD